jgi:uncharacterized protein YcbK (DUF882 family)
MRRRTLFLTSAATALLAGPHLAQAALRRRADLPDTRRLQLRHAASGAVFSGLYHNGLVADPVAMAELSEVLADTRTGEVRLFDPGAIDIVWEMGRRQRMTEFIVLSGYRTPMTNRAVNGAGDSQHLRAAALDLQIPAAKFAEFGESALKLARGGVGLYPQQGFIHLDSGPVRRWGGGDAPAVVAAAAPAPPRRSAAEQRIDRMAEAWASMRGR